MWSVVKLKLKHPCQCGVFFCLQSLCLLKMLLLFCSVWKKTSVMFIERTALAQSLTSLGLCVLFLSSCRPHKTGSDSGIAFSKLAEVFVIWYRIKYFQFNIVTTIMFLDNNILVISVVSYKSYRPKPELFPTLVRKAFLSKSFQKLFSLLQPLEPTDSWVVGTLPRIVPLSPLPLNLSQWIFKMLFLIVIPQHSWLQKVFPNCWKYRIERQNDLPPRTWSYCSCATCSFNCLEGLKNSIAFPYNDGVYRCLLSCGIVPFRLDCNLH